MRLLHEERHDRGLSVSPVVRQNAGRRAACGAVVGSLLVPLGACSNRASGGTTTKAQLARSGSPTPQVTISSAFAAPGDVVVDALGDLWVPNAGTEAVFEFTKSQLAKSGSPAPAKTISGIGNRVELALGSHRRATGAR